MPRVRGHGALARFPAVDLVAAALTGALLFAGVLLSKEDFFGSGSDLVTTEYPLAAFATSWMKRGVLPLWDPFIAGGVPFPAATKGYFYPPFWVGLLVSDAAAIKATCALHLAFAGAGAAWLCRPHVKSRLASYLGGALFATSGFFTAHLYAGHLELVEASAFAPWIVGIVDRLRAGGRVSWAASTLCVGLALLTGHYQMVAIACLGAVVFASVAAVASRTPDALPRALGLRAGRALLVLGALLVAGALLAAVQLLPTARMLAFTQRAAPDASFASSFAAAPVSFLAMLTPSLLGPDVPVFTASFMPWEASSYVGLTTLALAAFAITTSPRARWLPAVVTASLGALLALGDHTPLLGWLCTLVPPFQSFRAPGRYVLLVALFMALLAAIGLDAFVSCEQEGPERSHLAGPVAVAALAALLALALQVTSVDAFARTMAFLAPVRSVDPARWAVVLEHARDDAFLAVLALGAAAGTLLLGAPPQRRVAGMAVLVALALGDTMHAAQPFLATRPHAAFEPFAPLVAGLRKAMGPEGRLLPTPELFQPNAGAPYDLATATGYTIFLDDRYARFAKRALGVAPDAFATVVQADGSEPLFRHLGIRLVLTTARAVGPDGHGHLAIGDAHLLGGMGKLQVLALDAPVPRAVVVHSAEVVADEARAYVRMEDPSFRIEQTVLLESTASFPVEVPVAPAQEEARVTSYEPNEVTLRVEAAASGVVVLSDVYEPGWTATVDGVEAAMVPANRVMRAVPVAAGRHAVIMRYRPPGFVAGAWLSLLGLAIVLALAGVDRRRPRVA
jgi:hypothetical protein